MGERVRVDAYVVRADGPAAKQLLNAHRPTVRVVYRASDGRLLTAADTLRAMPEERWIVRGMTVPALIDPRRPHRAQILLEEIPPLDQRVLAADRPLCRLEEVAQEVNRLFNEAGVHEGLDPDDPFAGRIDEVRREMQAIEDGNREAERAAAAAARPQAPVAGPDGRLQGTADLVSCTMRPRGGGDPSTPPPRRWKGARIVRIWLYGYDPYPVVEHVKLDLDDRRTTIGFGAVPVTVSPADRTDVTYVWDGYDLDPRRALDERLTRDLRRAQADVAAMRAAFAPGLIEQAMAACHGVEQRRVLAEQMRAMGHEVPEHYLRDRERLAKLDALLARGVIDQAQYDQQAARC